MACVALASVPLRLPYRGRRVRSTRRVVRPVSTKAKAKADGEGDDQPPPDGYSDRKNLGKAYYEGFLKSSLGEDDSVQTGRQADTISASMKLGVQATVVLAALTLGFMASNGLL